MSLLKESIKRAAPILISTGVLLEAACGSDPITKDLDCNGNKKSSSTTIFVKKGEQIDIKGLPIKSSVSPNTIEIIPDQISENIKTIKIYKNGTIEFTLNTEGLISLPWWGENNLTYTVSWLADSRDNIEGTNLTIEAYCPDQK